MPIQLTLDQMDQLRKELAEGNKLAAVKMCKEWTGASLMEAKQFVETAIGDPNHKFTVGTDAPAVDSARMDEILDAIESGEKLRAVKIYRDSTGQNLMQSKQFIERLMDELGIVHKSGCLLMFLLLSFSASAAIAGAFWVVA